MPFRWDLEDRKHARTTLNINCRSDLTKRSSAFEDGATSSHMIIARNNL